MKLNIPNLLDAPVTVFTDAGETMKARFEHHKANSSLKQLIQVGGYVMRIDENALSKAVAQIGNGQPLTKGALLAHASSILTLVKIDKADKTTEGLTYADVVERARLLYAGYTITSDHPSPNWPRKDIVAGIFAIMGETKTGKSTYIRNTDVQLIVRASEPFEAVDRDPRVLQVATFTQAFAMILLCALAEVKCAVDSLRGLVYNLKGNAGEGGVSTALYELLTTLNNVSAEFGALTLVAINPMIGDEAKAARLFVRVEASLAGLVEVQKGAAVKGSYRMTNGNRVEHSPEFGPSTAEFRTFATEVPGDMSTSLMVNVDALGGDSPRSKVARTGLGKVDAPEETNADYVRQFPSIPFNNL